MKNQNNCKQDLTRKFQDILTRVSPTELNKFLLYHFGHSSFDDKTSTYTYRSKDNNKLYVTYSEDGKRVNRIEADSDFSKSSYQEIKATINDQLVDCNSKSIRSEVLFCRLPFRSSFRYKDLFILEPFLNYYPEDTLGPHPVMLHYKYPQRTIKPSSLEYNSSSNTLEELINLICCLTKGKIYGQQKVCPRVWVIDDKSKSSKIMEPGYRYDDQKSNIENKFNRDTENPNALYPNLNTDLINMYFKLEQNLREEFIQGCHWYRMAKTSLNYTNSYLSYITMIESFISTNKNSHNKHQRLLKKYQDINNQQLQNFIPKKQFTELLEEYKNIIDNEETISNKFKSFIKEYGGIDDDKLCGKLYNLRSTISHQGKLTARDKTHAIDLGLMTPKKNIEQHLRMFLPSICDRLLINWLKSKFNGYKVPITNIRELHHEESIEGREQEDFSWFQKTEI